MVFWLTLSGPLRSVCELCYAPPLYTPCMRLLASSKYALHASTSDSLGTRRFVTTNSFRSEKDEAGFWRVKMTTDQKQE